MGTRFPCVIIKTPSQSSLCEIRRLEGSQSSVPVVCSTPTAILLSATTRNGNEIEAIEESIVRRLEFQAQDFQEQRPKYRIHPQRTGRCTKAFAEFGVQQHSQGDGRRIRDEANITIGILRSASTSWSALERGGCTALGQSVSKR